MAVKGVVVVVGGCGHVGLPLAVALASAGWKVTSYDINEKSVARVCAGEMPFDEPGGPERLAAVLADSSFTATTDAASLAEADHVVVVVGTPVDEHLNPDPEKVRRTVRELIDHLRDDQHVVLRSTVYPGVTRFVESELASAGVRAHLSFCPERIAEGKAFTELYELPQVIAGCTPEATRRAAELFGSLTSSLIEVQPEEAELVKLFTNTWRYIKFAAANQLYMIANDYDIDFERIRAAMTQDYPRAADLPGPGFAAGPCLLKDTMQLAAFNNNNFTLGQASMMVNEGLPLYLVARLERRFDLRDLTVGILGMAFKGESDDIRSSLSYKLRRILRFKARSVLCTDPYVRIEQDPRLVDLDQVLEESDLLVIGAPHKLYRDLDTTKPVVDVWNMLREGVVV